MPIRTWTGNNPDTDKGPEFFDVTWTGKVLRLGEHNGYDDSDFYALVWDGDRPREITYASTRGWTYYNSATVDATDDVLAEYGKYRERLAAERAAMEALKPAKGKHARVIKGRKVPIGTAGEIFWIGADHYHRYRTRVGIKTGSGEKYFTDASNIEVTIKEA